VLRLFVVITVLVGCGLHRAYHPTLLTEEREVDPRALRSVGFVDLAFAMRFVGSSDGAPMLTVWLRSEGVEPVAIDMIRLRVHGYSASGLRKLQLQDPRGEIELVHIDPGALGRERFRLTDLGAKEGALRRVCVDPSPIFIDLSAAVPPVCFAPGPDAAWVVSP
jgi:hypothetical protein